MTIWVGRSMISCLGPATDRQVGGVASERSLILGILILGILILVHPPQGCHER
jgi:hypothetical protein